MSVLNLTPSPVAVLVQAVFFFLNLVIVKKLMLEPYLKIRSRRDAQTTGSKAEASQLISTTDEINNAITRKMQDTQLQIRAEVDAIRARSNTNRQQIIIGAEKTAKQALADLQHSIIETLRHERMQLPTVAKALAQQLMQKVLS